MRSPRVAITVPYLLAAGALFTFALSRFALVAPLMPGTNTDPAYQMALNAAFRGGLAFGRDVVFTFGPLGFLHVPMFDPVTFPWLVGFGAAVAALLVTDIAWIGMLAGRSALVVVVLGALIVDAATEPDARFYALAAGLALLAADAGGVPAVLFLLHAVAFAVFGLVKLSFLVLAVPIVLLVAAGIAVERVRLAVVFAGLFAGLTVALWCAVGQPLDLFVSFVRYGLAISSDYSEAMASTGPPGEILLYLGGAAALVALALARWWRERTRAAAIVFLPIALILFMGFKHGFVRQESHVATGCATLMAIAALLALTIGSGRRSRGAAVLAALGLLAAFRLHVLRERAVSEFSRPVLAARSTVGRLRRVGEAWRGFPSDRAAYERGLQRIATIHPVPVVEGTADVYSFGLHLLFAHQLRWAPRPVFQSYQVTSPPFAALNAAAVRDHGADVLLWDYLAIDGRLPASEDGPAWLEVMRWYDPVDLAGQIAILRRRPAARRLERTLLAERDIALGEWTAMPTGDVPTWATLDVHPNLLGRLARVLFRPPAMFLELELADGRHPRYRLVPGMAAAGFLLSPVVERPNGFVALLAADTRLSGAAVRRLRVVGDPGVEHTNASTVGLRLERLAFDPHPAPEPQGDAPTVGVSGIVAPRGTAQIALRATAGGMVGEATGGDPVIIAGVLSAPPSGERRTLVIDLEVPADDQAQVFLRGLDEPFSEEDSATFQTFAGRNRLFVDLPPIGAPMEFRLDPGSTPGRYLIHDLALRGRSLSESTPPAGFLRDGDPVPPWIYAADPPITAPTRPQTRLYAPWLPANTPIATARTLPVVAMMDATVIHDGPGITIESTGRDPAVELGPLPASGQTRLLQLDVELPVPDMMQVFWSNTPGTYGEERSLAFHCPAGRQVLQALLPASEGNVHLRLDPGTQPGRVRLHAIGVAP